MKMDEVAGSHNDEFYTPEYAVIPIIKYVPVGKTIWCPFDTEDSNFVKMFRNRGFQVVATHISNNQNFFFMKPPDCDLIISNPPYSKKKQRCFIGCLK